MADRGLDGASIIVVGASGGIGRHIAAQLAERGARLTLVARDVTRLDSRGNSNVVAADLRDA